MSCHLGVESSIAGVSVFNRLHPVQIEFFEFVHEAGLRFKADARKILDLYAATFNDTLIVEP